MASFKPAYVKLSAPHIEVQEKSHPAVLELLDSMKQ
jgi:hypothetical protein